MVGQGAPSSALHSRPSREDRHWGVRRVYFENPVDISGSSSPGVGLIMVKEVHQHRSPFIQVMIVPVVVYAYEASQE